MASKSRDYDLNLAEDDEFDSEEIEMGSSLFNHKDDLCRWDLGAVNLDTASEILEYFGGNMVELSYGVNHWAETQWTTSNRLNEDSPTDVRLIPLLSLPLVGPGDPGMLSSFAEHSLVSLSNLRSLTLGSRSPLHSTEPCSSIHPSWMTLPYQFLNTLTSLTLRLEHLDQSAFDFAALFSGSLTSLTLAAYETNLSELENDTDVNRPTTLFPLVRHLQLEGYNDTEFPAPVFKRLPPTSLPRLQVLRWKFGSQEPAEKSEGIHPIFDPWLGPVLRSLRSYSIPSGISQLQQVDLETTEEESASESILEKFRGLKDVGISLSHSWISPKSDRLEEPDSPDYPEEFPDLDEDSFGWNYLDEGGIDEGAVDSDGGYREDQYDNLPNYW